MVLFDASWIDSATAILTLISVGVGLLATGIPLVVSLVKLFKNKTAEQNWKTIMAMADAAIKEAEKTGKSGAEKKQIVIDAVKAGCKAAGIDADSFIDQLSAYIDQCIDFANGLNK